MVVLFGRKRRIHVVEEVLIVALEEIAADRNFLFRGKHFLVEWRKPNSRLSFSDVILSMLEFVSAHQSC